LLLLEYYFHAATSAMGYSRYDAPTKVKGAHVIQANLGDLDPYKQWACQRAAETPRLSSQQPL